jgi:uncharacterized membrane protein YczE
MLIGIFFSSLGVSLSLKSKLGATPIGVCPAVFSPFLQISTGMAMGILLGLFFLAQIIILGSEFSLFQVMQLVASVLYGCSVDLTTNILSIFPNEAVWQQVIYCGLGIVFLALGVFIMLKANFFMLPQDALVNVISEKYRWEYGKIKIALDSILTSIAAISSWLLHHKLVHVGTGTIAAAVFVGMIISRLKEFEGLNYLLEWAIGEI